MKKLPLFLTGLLFVLTTSLSAQTPYDSEKSTGYLGVDIPGLTLYEDAFSFLVMGDFGRVGDYYQKQVARELGNAAIVADAEFIISTGDNFYPNGVQSTQDYHWISSFESIYTNPALYMDWYTTLGNHDYRGSIQAQIDYTNISRRWHMPAPYYSKTFELENGKKLLLVVMDTNPFIDDYQTEPQKYPALAKQDTLAQMKWLNETLGTKDASIDWKIVVGHHPLYSGGKRKMDPNTLTFEAKFADLFDKYKVDAYLCGHEHDLQIIRPKGRYTTQFLSGSASEVRASGRREGTLFSAAEPGFMAFTIVENKLIVQSIKANESSATVLNKIEIEK